MSDILHRQKKSKGKKNVAVLSTSRPLRGKTTDDGNEKSQIITFDHFTKGGTDIINQLNDYYTTRSKSFLWVMVVLSHMLDMARVNEKTLWYWKNDLDISSTSSYNFSWNFAKSLALLHGQQKRCFKLFLLTVLLVDKPVPKVERRFTVTGQMRSCDLHMANYHTKK